MDEVGGSTTFKPHALLQAGSPAGTVLQGTARKEQIRPCVCALPQLVGVMQEQQMQGRLLQASAETEADSADFVL